MAPNLKENRPHCVRINFPYRRAAVEILGSWFLSASLTVSVYIQGRYFLW